MSHVTNNNPFAESTPVSYPFIRGKKWAGDLYTVIPGTKEKTPMVAFKEFIWPERKVPTRIQLTEHRTLGIADGASPILLLDSPLSNRHLCVVDVDDMSALKDVLVWLVSLGIHQTLSVTTGREGGGVHLYFAREEAHACDYKSSIHTAFGRYTRPGAEKDSNRVDFKAYNQYVICPGAVHKSGKVYKAFWGKEEVGSLTEILGELPVMPLAAWKEKREVSASEDRGQGKGKVEWMVEGPEWQTVLADGRERQACPWCHRGGARALSYKADSGLAYCFAEAHPRKLRKALPEKGTIVDSVRDLDKKIDALVADVPGGCEREDIIHARHWAGYLFEQEVSPVCIDAGDIPVLEDDSPLRGKEIQMGLAAKILASRYGAGVGRHISCTRAPVICVGYGSASSGMLSEKRGSCRSFGCADCGPHLVEALRAAAFGEAIALTFGQFREDDERLNLDNNTVSARVALESLTNKATRALTGGKPRFNRGGRFWCARLRRSSAGHKNLADQFRRLGASSQGCFSWLGVAVSPSEVEYIFFFSREGGGLPKAESPLAFLFDTECPEPLAFDAAIQAAFEAIDFPAWDYALASGLAKRINLLLGPSALTEAIQATYNWLTGQTKKESKKVENTPDSMRYSVPTFRPSEVRAVVQETLQEQVVMEEVSSSSHAMGVSRSAQLSTSPGPILREAVKSGKLESCAGHRKAKKVSMAAVVNSLIEEI